ncbi:MAG: 2-succinyl-6-hydroxy-2,4-cyclohexadiene-1-carboxylate synthase [Dehalococcoidia bacterium]|nr:2-succinyl-6-hydroxy-2,4-cyclohexadiene-1-carboxylate synthase [Dehalococcoidia bacterium]
MTRIAVTPGFHLNVESSGAGEPLVLLHGFTGSARSWGPLIGTLAASRQVLAVDMVGHGCSYAPPDLQHYQMEQVTADIIAVLQSMGIRKADWLGYSMGGRTALSLAVAHPDAVGRLVLIGASPGLADPGERADRIAADDALADRIQSAGVPAFVDYWESIPLFASQARLPEAQRAAIRRGRLANSPLGLANSLRGMGTGVQPFVDAGRVTMPVLALAGELDRKFVAIGQEMTSQMACARFELMVGAGHAAHLERPGACAEAIERFFATPTPTPTGGPE